MSLFGGFKRTSQPTPQKRASAEKLVQVQPGAQGGLTLPPADQCEHHGFLTKKAKTTSKENKRYFVLHHNVRVQPPASSLRALALPLARSCRGGHTRDV